MIKEQLRKAWRLFAVALLAAAGAVLLPDMVQAASTSGPLSDVYTTLTEWAQGNVGKTIALSMIIVGFISGVARQSLMGLAVGVGSGVALYNAPTIVDTVFNATLHPGLIN